MKRTILLFTSLIAATSLSAATVSWDNGAVNNPRWENSPTGPDNWDTDTNPVSGVDSVVLNIGGNVFMRESFVIASGQSLTNSNMTLRTDAPSTTLTVQSGGTLDFTGGELTNQRSDGGRLILEAGSTATGTRYYSQNSGTTEFVANAVGVTTLELAEIRLDGGILEVDLTNYNIASGTTLALFDYNVMNGSATGSGIFNTITLTGGLTGTIDYAFDQGGGDLAIALTNIAVVPEPSSYALLLGGLVLGASVLRRRRA